jgi:ketosteroid isomerase-like protein
MPEARRLQSFIDRVVGGHHVEAIQEYYHADASMQENLAQPRKGIEALIDHERRALERMVSMYTHPPRVVIAQGDDVVIHWIFDVTDADGVIRRLDELALQRWRGDRIESERFFYDSATAWRAVEAAKLAQP